MAAIAATISDVQLVAGAESSISHSVTGKRKTYRLMCVLGTQTAGDTAAVLTGNQKIQNILKSGATITLRAAAAAGPGVTPGGTHAYALNATIDGTTIGFAVGSPTAAAAVASGTTAHVYVTVDET